MTRLPRRRSLALALVALLGLPVALAGCASPTLPLPPPETPTVTIGEGGLVTLTGSGIPGALVYGYNQMSEQGVIVKASDYGSYSMTLKAADRDFIAVWQEYGTDRSPSTLVEIRIPATK